jgi:hypothetical protein
MLFEAMSWERTLDDAAGTGLLALALLLPR